MQEPRLKKFYAFTYLWENAVFYQQIKSTIYFQMIVPMYILTYVLVPIIYLKKISNFTKSSPDHSIDIVYIDMLPSYVIQAKAAKAVYDSKLSIINQLEYRNLLRQFFSLKYVLICECLHSECFIWRILDFTKCFLCRQTLSYILNIRKVDKLLSQNQKL